MGNVSSSKKYGSVRTSAEVPDEISHLFFSKHDSNEIESISGWNLASKSLSYFNILPNETQPIIHHSPSLPDVKKVVSSVLTLHHNNNHYLVLYLFTFEGMRYACILDNQKSQVIFKLDKTNSISLDKFELATYRG